MGLRSEAILFALLALILSLAAASPIVTDDAVQPTTPQTAVIGAQSTHSPIVISSDEDFKTQGWPGNGTRMNPYVIGNLTISSNDVALSVSGTSVHFIIANCMFLNDVDPSLSGTGVRIEKASFGTIRNCTFVGFATAVMLSEARSILVEMVEVTGCLLATDISFSSDAIVSACEFASVKMGVYVLASVNVTVDGCRGDAPASFITSFLSDDCSVTRNVVTDPRGGMIAVFSGTDWFISDNVLGRGGLYFAGGSDGWLHTVVNNTVLGRPILFLTDVSDTSVPTGEYGQVIMHNSTDVSLIGLSFQDISVPVEIGFCHGVTIDRIKMDRCGKGLYVEMTTNISVVDSTFGDCLFALDVQSTIGLTVSDTVFARNVRSIFLSVVDDVDIENCEFVGKYDAADALQDSASQGRPFALSAVQSTPAIDTPHLYPVLQSFLTNASIGANHCSGLSLRYNRIVNASAGVLGVALTNFEVRNNTIVGCGGDGVLLNYSSQGVIVYNTITDNQGYGVVLDFNSDGIRTWGNVFARNMRGNARDDHQYNSWDDGDKMGNYWDDYDGKGPYLVDGLAGNIDQYPRALDSDGDGLSDYEENHVYGTDSLNPDTDGGGEDDLSEIEAGRDPLDPSDDFQSFSIEIPLLPLVAVVCAVVVLGIVGECIALRRAANSAERISPSEPVQSGRMSSASGKQKS